VIISPFGNPTDSAKLKKNIQIIKPEVEVVLLNNFSNIRSSDDIMGHGPLDYIVELEDLRRLLLHANHKTVSKSKEDSEGKGIKEFLFDLTDLLLSILEIDDDYFSGNNHTVMKLSRKVAKRMGLNRELIDATTLGSLLRDLGKIGIDKEILNGPRALTDEEFLLVKEHSQTSLSLLKKLNLPWRVDQVILHHHEAYDGSGYPSGLKGREVSVGARILSVVDSYTAMTADRPYRKAKERSIALEEIQQKAGSRYDPEVVEIFMKVIREEWEKKSEKKETILVVEDEQFMQALIKLHMTSEGFEVLCARNGAEAIVLIKGKKPDLIISDFLMPVMDGFKLCSALSHNLETKDIPFIFLSANKKAETRLHGLKLGAIDYITKPFDLEELSLKVNTILKRNRIGYEEMEEEKGVVGRLETMNLPDIVQFMNLGLKTAQVEVRGEEPARRGVIYFSRGEVTYASAGDLEGEDAFFEMLRWNQGQFNILHGVQPDAINISKSATALLIDGMKYIDENKMDLSKEPSR
jgi:response regulator RpfG family c-di-GMP phosphodiesterase